MGASSRHLIVGFTGNVGARFTQALASFTGCERAVEMGNREVELATPRIESEVSTLFGLSRGVVEPFRYGATPSDATSWPTGTMFWDNLGLAVVDNQVVKHVQLEAL